MSGGGILACWTETRENLTEMTGFAGGMQFNTEFSRFHSDELIETETFLLSIETPINIGAQRVLRARCLC